MSDICNDPTYVNSINQRNRFRLLNVPPQRYNNLAQSPYLLNYNQQQLNMRRKAEILEYNASKTNTKTNNYTKSEKWKQLVDGSSQRRTLSQSYIQKNAIPGTNNYVQTCPSGTILLTPSYASDVPGPIIHLYNDPAIPLYMYGEDANSYAIINKESDTEKFTYDNTLNNTNKYLINVVKKESSVTVTSIYIKNITSPTYRFSIKFPISIFMTANVKSGLNNPLNYKETFTLNFIRNNPFQPYIYYGADPVENALNNALIYSPDRKSVSFDISMNPNPNDPSNNSFFANQYIGMYEWYYLTLQTQYGYVYDVVFKNLDLNGDQLLNITYPANSVFNDYFENLSYGICLNVADDTANTFTNCYPRNLIQKGNGNILSIT